MPGELRAPPLLPQPHPHRAPGQSCGPSRRAPSLRAPLPGRGGSGRAGPAPQGRPLAKGGAQPGRPPSAGTPGSARIHPRSPLRGQEKGGGSGDRWTGGCWGGGTPPAPLCSPPQPPHFSHSHTPGKILGGRGCCQGLILSPQEVLRASTCRGGLLAREGAPQIHSCEAEKGPAKRCPAVSTSFPCLINILGSRSTSSPGNGWELPSAVLSLGGLALSAPTAPFYVPPARKVTRYFGKIHSAGPFLSWEDAVLREALPQFPHSSPQPSKHRFPARMGQGGHWGRAFPCTSRAPCQGQADGDRDQV